MAVPGWNGEKGDGPWWRSRNVGLPRVVRFPRSRPCSAPPACPFSPPCLVCRAPRWARPRPHRPPTSRIRGPLRPCERSGPRARMRGRLPFEGCESARSPSDGKGRRNLFASPPAGVPRSRAVAARGSLCPRPRASPSVRSKLALAASLRPLFAVTFGPLSTILARRFFPTASTLPLPPSLPLTLPRCYSRHAPIALAVSRRCLRRCTQQHEERLLAPSGSLKWDARRQRRRQRGTRGRLCVRG